MSVGLASKIQLGLEELAAVREQLPPLIAKSAIPKVSDIETAAASAMLHSFYTEIEKLSDLPFNPAFSVWVFLLDQPSTNL